MIELFKKLIQRRCASAALRTGWAHAHVNWRPHDLPPILLSNLGKSGAGGFLKRDRIV